MKPFLRLVVCSDLHSGHQVGLTHPDFDARPQSQDKVAWKLYQVRRKMYDFYHETIEGLKPIDVAIVNGDCIEGKGSKSGGTELIAADRNEQAGMAAAAIEDLHAGQIYMTFGTPFHVGVDEDFEQQVADKVKAEKIGGHDWLNVRGLVIDYRHFVGRSTVPYSRGTQLGKEMIWNLLWAERGEYPRADVIVRSHIHQYSYTGDTTWLGITTPALQGYYSKFGTRICSGTVDFGLISIDVYGKGKFTWQAHILRLKSSRLAAVKVKEPEA